MNDRQTLTICGGIIATAVLFVGSLAYAKNAHDTTPDVRVGTPQCYLSVRTERECAAVITNPSGTARYVTLHTRVHYNRPSHGPNPMEHTCEIPPGEHTIRVLAPSPFLEAAASAVTVESVSTSTACPDICSGFNTPEARL
ncbi:hypothetical protein [Streptomyces sp. gCLA4]|uniref:hypothetical protein n=1 Tax=Streptomyces sp. gCLA4 TaxID=1873416 RepID=UPI0015FF3AA6|nr:hypothetical protein [Streptomyces sp. gCLA4]